MGEKLTAYKTLVGFLTLLCMAALCATAAWGAFALFGADVPWLGLFLASIAVRWAR